MSLHSLSLQRRQQKGVTLILVLSFVLLLTAVVLVFLSRAMIARQLSSGSLKQSSADQFALSALDVVTGNLKQEIASPTLSSSGTYNSTYVVYRPLSSTNAVPIRFGNPAFTSPSPDPAPNLIRISSRSDNGQSFPSSLASAVNSTTDASVNGRAVTLPRWNSHYLLPVQTPANASSDSTPVASFAPPDWVLVTDTGGPTVLTAPSPSVIGRYAYAIYDEGGLLDVNVAGYPSKSTTAQSGDKPGLAYADLTQLASPSYPTGTLSQTDVDNLVGWRNYASVQPTGAFNSFTISAGQAQNFFSMITNNVTGFMTVNPVTYNNCTDQAFLSRQQLLKYRASAGFNANVLQYLGTFSRDLNAPSWSPSTPAGSTIDYAGQSRSSSSINRDVLDVRVTSTFTRADGTTAQIGEPLIKYRFPLNRLGGLTYKGMVTNDPNQGIDLTDNTTLINGVLSPATAATIQRDFGLVYNPGNASANYPHWDYCGASNPPVIQPSIATLDAVAKSTPGREPNFFELLKAAILSGSLGRDAGANGTYNQNYDIGPASGNQTNDLNVDIQIFQLGANIIDQSDSDSYPTEIHFTGFIPNANGGTTGECAVYGIENLPYLQRVFAKTLRYNDSGGNPNGASGLYLAEVWNPHQNFGYNNTSAIPSNYRFCGEGNSAMFIPIYTSPTPAPTLPPNSPSCDLSQSGYIQFSVPWNSNTCREPTFISTDPNQGNYLAPTLPIASGPNGSDDPFNNGTCAGIYTGSITIPAGDNKGDSAGVQPQFCDLMLEYQAPDSSWRIYDKMRNLTGEHDWDPWAVCFYYQHVDPRTDRFGTSVGVWYYPTPFHQPGFSIRQDRGQGWWSYDFSPLVTSGFNFAGTSNAPAQIFSNWNPNPPPGTPTPTSFFMGTLSDNVVTTTDSSNALPSQVSYADQDGVVRPAEGAYAVDPQGDGRPLMPSTTTGNFNSRPIILNRPFRNVGELGYAFRDEPWKDVDFFTSSTGDAGLLDFFCINESTTTTPMVAGTVSLNTRQAPILQAILAGAIRDETGNASSPSTTPILNTEAASIANSIVSWTQSSSAGQGPFQYRGDLLTKAASTLVVSNANTWQQQIKIQREAALRALSDVGTTRTWTLLVDLVAQVGHYPPGATSLKQFVVDGEKRYWLHLTIDRNTGQVVDRVLEPVYE